LPCLWSLIYDSPKSGKNQACVFIINCATCKWWKCCHCRGFVGPIGEVKSADCERIYISAGCPWFRLYLFSLFCFRCSLEPVFRFYFRFFKFRDITSIPFFVDDGVCHWLTTQSKGNFELKFIFFLNFCDILNNKNRQKLNLYFYICIRLAFSMEIIITNWWAISCWREGIIHEKRSNK
jgi:hypothetical protein